MKRIALHVFAPAVARAAGCKPRELALLAFVILAVLAGLAAAIQALPLNTMHERASCPVGNPGSDCRLARAARARAAWVAVTSNQPRTTDRQSL